MPLPAQVGGVFVTDEERRKIEPQDTEIEGTRVKLQDYM